MSYLLFLDESGHDHRQMPYEIHAGMALHAKNLWPFVTALMELEISCFGEPLHRFGTEIKGEKLLSRDRFKWAAQADPMDNDLRQKHALGFLRKGLSKQAPTRQEFTAFGQSCLEFVRGVLKLLLRYEAIIFGCAIPRGTKPPPQKLAEDMQPMDMDIQSEPLRKDLVFLMERYFYFLDAQTQMGLMVMDETEKQADRRFVRRLERYFQQTATGRYRTSRVVPSPLFVSSDMAYPVQVADIISYCINHGYRNKFMSAPAREDIQQLCGTDLQKLEFHGDGYRSGEVFKTHGIVLVSDPYTPRNPMPSDSSIKKGDDAFRVQPQGRTPGPGLQSRQ